MSFDQWCTPTIANNLIKGNSASSNGGAIHFQHDSEPMISNNTIVSNVASGLGGGICSGDTTSAHTIIDCILEDNGDDLFDCQASYCCIEREDVGEGNIHNRPMFVSGPLGNYYLGPSSPCVDAGSRKAASAGLDDRTTQADESLDTYMVDMGYHYPVSGATQPTLSLQIANPPDFYYNTILLSWTPMEGANSYQLECEVGGTELTFDLSDNWLRFIAVDEEHWHWFCSLGTVRYKVIALDASGAVLQEPTDWTTCTCY